MPSLTFEEPALLRISREKSLKMHKPLTRRTTPGGWPGSNRSTASSSSESLGSSASALLPSEVLVDLSSGLPPTPPSNRNSGTVAARSPTWIAVYSASSPSRTGGISTPPTNRSPPTPDNTPPRAQSEFSGLPVPFELRHIHSGTESFRTAREHQRSPIHDGHDDAGSEVSGDKALNENAVDRTHSFSKREVGLGLGLESDDDRTPTRSRSISVDDVAVAEVVSLNGNWGHELSGHELDPADAIADREWEANFMRNVTLRKRRTRRARNQTQQEKLDPAVDGVGNEDLQRGSSLRDKTYQRRFISKRRSIEDFSEQVEWPSIMVKQSPGMDNIHIRRYSGNSATSTIVEALVIENPPQRRRTLRHTGQMVGQGNELRIQKSSSIRTTSNPVTASEKIHRLTHKSLNVGDQKGLSLYSNALGHNVGSSGSTSTEVVPVIIVPERQSSLKRKPGLTRQAGSKSVSLTSGSQASRPTTAEDLGDSRHPPRFRRRTLSGGITSLNFADGGKGSDFAPVIPSRSSSLSAPTSRVTSRTTSLTSASLRSRPTALGVSSIHNGHRDITASDQGTTEFLSVPITPFSNPSSTPEALEVSQATAVNIYPHNNDSVLVVQSNSRPVTAGADQHGVSQEGPRTPLSSYSIPVHVESPLRNPRVAPLPPQLIQVIPPTPMHEIDKQLGAHSVTVTGNNQNSGAFAKVRRALSARRYSEGFMLPLSRWKSVGSSVRRPSNIERKDSKLHPFWRPRAFWEEFDEDGDAINEDFLERGWTPWLLNGSEERSRHSFGLEEDITDGSQDRGARHQTSESLSTKRSNRRRRSGIRGLQFEYIGWKGFQQKLRKSKAVRQERALERKRRNLRQLISPPKPVDQVTR